MQTYKEFCDIDESNDEFKNMDLLDICPVDGRFLEVIYKDMRNPRLTINACSGRVTLKLSKNTDKQVVDDIMKIVSMVRFCSEFEGVTYRGRFSRNKADKLYIAMMPAFKKRETLIFSVDM